MEQRLFSFDTIIQIHSIGDIDILNIDTTYCIDERLDTLIGYPLYSSGYGVFDFITGLDVNTFNSDSAIFNPAAAGSGTHNIHYTYTNNVSNCVIRTL